MLVVILSACGSKEQRTTRAEAIAKTRFFVDRYGQIVSPKQRIYLTYLQNRLTAAFDKSFTKNEQFEIVLLNTRYPIAASAGGGVVMISKGVVNALQNEAELAFILAHEMSHQYLNHRPPAIDGFFPEMDEKIELEADRLAAAAMSVAGYDPRYAITALKNTYHYAGSLISEKKDYPSLEKRVKEISSLISSSGWQPPGTVNRREFVDFRKSLS